MDSRHARPPSPGSRRISTQPTRSSTGTLVYPSSYDPPYYGPTRSSGNVAAGPRISAERVAAPRIVPKYRAESPSRKPSRDDYVVRPRRLTLDPQAAATTRRPLSMIGPTSPSRNRPIITSSVDRPGSPLSKPSRIRPDESYYLQPASTSSRREHHRGYTIGSTRESDRLTADDRDARERTERGGYRSSGIGGGRSGYYLDQPLVRQTQNKDDHGYGHDYNERREQMYRDLAPKPRPRRDSYNAVGRERPTSMTGMEDLMKRVPVISREAGPPVSMRGFEGLARASSVRQDRRPREEYIPREYARDDFDRPSQKHSRAQVALHHPSSDRYDPYPLEQEYEVRQPRVPKPVVEPKTVHEPKPVLEERPERHEPRSRDVYDDRDRGDDHSRRYHEQPHKVRDPIDDRDRRRDDDREHRREQRHREAEPIDSRDRRKEKGGRDVEPVYDRERRKERHRDTESISDRALRREERHKERRDDNHRGDTAAMVGAAGAAASGLAAVEGVRQHRAHRDERDRLAVPPEPSESTSVSASVDGSDEERREHRHRRRREREQRREREEREERELREAGDHKRREPEDLGLREAVPARDREESAHDSALPRQNGGSLRESTSYERPSHNRQVSSGSISNDRPSHDQPILSELALRRSRPRRHYPHTQDKESYSESTSSESDFDERPRQVRVVTPTNEPIEPKEPPKGILRQPKDKFPEDPAPVREGVAPLKDAGKKGIPPNARWTKIDRKLVNPEALDAGNERYEERTDFVIVLRVLTKEEIEQYALKTQEIRGKRAERRDDEDDSRGS